MGIKAVLSKLTKLSMEGNMYLTCLWVASIVCILWGIGHLIPTKNIVTSFGELTVENRLILVMEWIAEGLTLIFIGLMIGALSLWGDGGNTSKLVLELCAAMLLVMAVLSLFTGARTSILPMRLCPVIKTIVSILVVIALLNE